MVSPYEGAAFIALIAIATLLSRMAGAELMRYVPLSPVVMRFLDGMAVSVIAAFVATLLLNQGSREAACAAAAGVVMLATRNATLSMFIGVLCGAVLAL